jgi:excisionase family DNA binding protein
MLCNGILFFVGAVIFFTAKVKISSRKLVLGSRARVVGVLLMLPVPLSLLVELIFGSNEYVGQVEALLFFMCLLLGVIVGLSDPTQEIRSYENLPPILTIPEAARYLKISEKDVEHLIIDRRLQATRIGKHYRIAKEQIEAMFR